MNPTPDPDRRLILEMLAKGKITPEEAEKLLAHLDDAGPEKSEAKASDASGGQRKPRPTSMCILVDEGPHGEKINLRIPLAILRSGMKLASILPGEANAFVAAALDKEGIHIGRSKIKAQDLNEFLDQLQLDDLIVDLDDKGARVRIFCE